MTNLEYTLLRKISNDNGWELGDHLNDNAIIGKAGINGYLYFMKNLELGWIMRPSSREVLFAIKEKFNNLGSDSYFLASQSLEDYIPVFAFAANEFRQINKSYSTFVREDNDKDLEEDASKSDLNRLKRAITENYEYLSEYGKFEARKCLKRRRMRYRDWFWFYLFITYSMQTYMLASAEQIIFDNTVRQTYENEINNLKKDMTPKQRNIKGLADKLINEPNSKGYIWKDYRDTVTLYNTDELYKQFVLNKRANKPLVLLHLLGK